MRIRIAAAVAAWSLTSCQQDQGDCPAGLQSETRDSAGIRIVENTRPRG